MRRLLLARGRALCWCACVALAVAGCTGAAAPTGATVSGHTLTIYLSEPQRLTPEQRDVIDAEQLALRLIGGHVASFTVKAVTVARGELSDNARAAIADPTTIAYLGELEPGTSGQTIGITNAQDILQVSPTDTAIELTHSTPAVPGSPNLYYESLSSNGRTFARVAPTDKLEARALVGQLPSLGVKHLYVLSDHSDYGDALAGLLRADASSIAASSLANADGVVYAGSSMAAAARTFNHAVATNPSVKLFVASVLADGTLVAALSPGARRNLYVISPGFNASDLPAQGQQFESQFRAAYGRPPATAAIFGWAAMEAVLAALENAGSAANNHQTVTKDFLRLRNQTSVLGTYAITSGGDISFANGAPFVLSRVRAGKLLPFRAVQQQG